MRSDRLKSSTERCTESEKFKKIDAAFREGDLTALRAAVDDPDSVPNGPMPPLAAQEART